MDDTIIGVDEEGNPIIKNDEITIKNEDGEIITCKILDANLNENGMEVKYVKPNGEKYTFNLEIDN